MNNVRRAIYDIPEYCGKDPTFRKITERIRQAMSKGKKKLRLACKSVFLATDESSKRVPLDDINEVKKHVADDVAEALMRTEEPEPPRANRADEDRFVPSIHRLSVDTGRSVRLILASDGVWDNVPAGRVLSILKTEAPPGTDGESAALAVARAVTLEARRSAEEGSQMDIAP